MYVLADLFEDYDALAKGLPIEDRTGQLSSLLKFEDNLDEPIHRWFNFKEGFSGSLVSALLTEFSGQPSRASAFLDPFAGVGTSLLAAEDTLKTLGAKSLTIRGIEVNPYIHFVCSTKMAWDRYDPQYLLSAGETTLNGMKSPGRLVFPELSTFKNARFVPPARLREIVELREKIRVAARKRPERSLLLLGLAATAETAFNLRKDGRALRFFSRPDATDIKDELSRKWHAMAQDLSGVRSRGNVDYEVSKGDGRRADSILPRAQFHNILFSPPYLNNIDYTEVYKLELWLLGFVASPGQMLNQRRLTFRSHPSCSFPAFADATVDEVKRSLGPRFQRFGEYAESGAKWRRRLFEQYFADMLRTLRGCRRLIRGEGKLFLIIGNSLHGNGSHSVPVAADLWITALAPHAGMRVEKVLIGRRLRRRIESPLMRESVIIMSKV